jgi:hypothetical protein
MQPQASDLQPFIETPDSASPYANVYRFGYRLNGVVVSSLHLPVETVEKHFLAETKLSVRITPCGDIVPGLSSPNLTIEVALASKTFVSIDDLMRETLSAEALRMEEATPEDLTLLCNRLERATAMVRSALDRASNS